jgi:hypothetical protein
MHIDKIKIVLLASPRSGSSYLRSKIDGSTPIYGELLLKKSKDPISHVLQNVNPKQGWKSLLDSNRAPSITPGEKSLSVAINSDIVGLKIMGADFLLKNRNIAFRLFQEANIVVFIKPISFRRQVISLLNIRMGGVAHHYLNDTTKRKYLSESKRKLQLLQYAYCFINILVNRIICRILQHIAKIMRKNVIIADQRCFSEAQSEIALLINSITKKI